MNYSFLPSHNKLECKNVPNYAGWEQGNHHRVCVECDADFVGSHKCCVCSDCAYKSKGKRRGTCNRTSCGAMGAVWFNKGSNAYYCAHCAQLINRSKLEDGSVLCSLDEKAAEETSIAASTILAAFREILAKEGK